MTPSKFERAIYALRRQGIKYDLERMRVLSGLLGRPERRFKSLHVAGTNGKGSTAAYLAAMVQAAGYRVGLNTSPHLVSFRERIRINGKSASEELLLEQFNRALPALREADASFFEATTMLAFIHFADAEVDVAVAEVGLGGRLDATNILEPLGSVITSLDLEHTRILGRTIREIAGEKAGIIKAHPVVTTASQPEGIEAISKIADERGATLRVLRKGIDWTYEPGVLCWQPDTEREQVLIPGLTGEHQAENAACALGLAEMLDANGTLKLPADVRRIAIEACAWPGRFQRSVIRGQDVIFDVAHNPPGARYLIKTLRDHPVDGPVVAVVGMLRDKRQAEFFREIGDTVDHVWTTTPPSDDRALAAEDLAEIGRAEGVACTPEADIARAVERALDQAAAAGGRVVITGSLFTVGGAMAALDIHPADTPAGLDPARIELENAAG